MGKTDGCWWMARGDLGAFFGLFFDNLANLVVLTALLNGVFGFPTDFILRYMIPGTAMGVLLGDVAYSWMAIRLGRRTGRREVTAMPLGLDTPSTIGVAVAVIGPVYLESRDPLLAWQVGMATMVLMGVVKVVLSFAGRWIQRLVPQAGLLGSLAGVGIALLGVLPLTKLFQTPVVGLLALGLVLLTLVARAELPGRLSILPGAALAVLAGTAAYYVLGEFGALGTTYHRPDFSVAWTPPLPTLGFAAGLERALDFLPVAVPFGLLTIIGGINVSESARVAGDDFNTRDILLVEAMATLVAGLCGGVAQSTPYIGHPAYKAMGARAGYTLACGLAVGLGGCFGLVSSLATAIPEAAVVPILVFVGLEITSQTFTAVPRAHYPAAILAVLPGVADLVFIQWQQLAPDIGHLPGHLLAQAPVVAALGNGFILTAMLWGGLGAFLIDRHLGRAASFALICAVLSAFGLIHSCRFDGGLYLPWRAEGVLHWHLAAGYVVLSLLCLAWTLLSQEKKQG